jgi:putative membrane protein insertion efficiency factor
MVRKGIAAGILVALLVWDLTSPPSQQVTAKAAIFAIRVYQKTYGRVLKKSNVCRFQPTCSNYGIQAFQKYGSLKGFWKTAGRLLRCSPFTSDHGVDLP